MSVAVGQIIFALQFTYTYTPTSFLPIPPPLSSLPFSCHNFADMFTALTRVLPNYFATYLPIIMVMLINPVVYHSASNDIDMDMATGTLQVNIIHKIIESRI